MPQLANKVKPLTPLTASLKWNLRDIFCSTPEWDHEVTPEQRFVWIQNSLDVENCKGTKLHRPRMPKDAINTKMRLWVLVDAAKELIPAWSTIGFKRRDGTWSCAFLVGRCLLALVDCTIPRAELEALPAESNKIWITINDPDTPDPKNSHKIMARATSSKYLLLSTKHTLPKITRVLAIHVRFLEAFTTKYRKKPGYTTTTEEPPIHYNCFLLSGKSMSPVLVNSSAPIYIQEGTLTMQLAAHASHYKKHDATCSQKNCGPLSCPRIRDTDIQQALHYLCKTATAEVREFVKPEKINKNKFGKDGILFHLSRIIDGHIYTQAAGMDQTGDLSAQSISCYAPVIDRCSPLTYASADTLADFLACVTTLGTDLGHGIPR